RDLARCDPVRAADRGNSHDEHDDQRGPEPPQEGPSPDFAHNVAAHVGHPTSGPPVLGSTGRKRASDGLGAEVVVVLVEMVLVDAVDEVDTPAWFGNRCFKVA